MINNILIEFYQHCWEIVKFDIVRIFDHFFAGTLDVHRPNYGVITLLLKLSDGNKIQQYRPICLLRYIYKWITKTLDLRTDPFTDKLFSCHQNAFIKNRYIVDGILSLHELMHNVHIKKQVGIIIKLNFEKTYDKVNWDFLISCHEVRGFSDKWCSWVKQILKHRTVSIKMNDEMGPYFQSFKGVRQGDPFSPFLFNMAAECLTKMILKAQKNHMIVGMAPDLIENGVVVLQYADDTVLCINHEPDKAINLKLLLFMFEMISGLKVNYNKSGKNSVGSDNNIT